MTTHMHLAPSTAVESAIAGHLAWLQASRCSPSTVELRRWHLRKVMRDLGTADPWTVSTVDLVGYLAAQPWQASTTRSYRTSLRVFYQWGVDHGHLERSPAAVLPRVRVPRSLPRPTPEPAYRAALATARAEVLAGVILAGQCGLRRGEIARVRREDVTAVPGGHVLRVLGKGGHVRHVPLPDELVTMLLGRPAGFLFPSPRRPGRPLTAEWVGRYIAGHLPEGLGTHSLRHRCATVALDATRDLRAVQELLGHASPETTAIYTHVAGDRIRAAVEAAA